MKYVVQLLTLKDKLLTLKNKLKNKQKNSLMIKWILMDELH